MVKINLELFLIVLLNIHCYGYILAKADQGEFWLSVSTKGLENSQTISWLPNFNTVPSLLIGYRYADYQGAQFKTNNGFNFTIQTITNNCNYLTQSMKVAIIHYRFNQNEDYNVITWFATNDPRIFIKQVHLDMPASISQGTGYRSTEVKIPISWAWKNQTNVKSGIFLSGFINEGISAPCEIFPSIYLKVTNYQNNEVTILLSTTGSNKILKVSFFIILAAGNNIIINELRKVFDSSHPFRWELWTDRSFFIPFQYPKQFVKKTLFNMAGFNGIELFSSTVNVRIKIDLYPFNYRLNAWSDTLVKSVSGQLLIYYEDNQKIFSSDCVEIYSLCDFAGTLILVCKNDPTHPPIYNGNFTMRSISVPQDFQIDLVNNLDYGGGEMTALVQKTFSCLGQTKFNHATLI